MSCLCFNIVISVSYQGSVFHFLLVTDLLRILLIFQFLLLFLFSALFKLTEMFV